MSITRWCLRSRTGFGYYLSQTLCLPRDGPSAPPTALLPLPLPVMQPFADGPRRSNDASNRTRAIDRALHVIVCALKYQFWSKASPPFDLLRRQPNDNQSKAIMRLRLLLEACDRDEPIEVASSGRKNLQLVTRLDNGMPPATWSQNFSWPSKSLSF